MFFLELVIVDSMSTMKTMKYLANYILENNIASFFGDILTACIIFI